MKSDSPSPPQIVEPQDAIASGFVDDRARGEYVRLGAACFLVAVTNAHSALLAIIFTRSGYDLHDIGLLLSIFAVPVVLSALVSGAVADRLGALMTVRLAMVLLTIGFLSFDMTRASFSAAIVSRIIQAIGQGLFLGSSLTYVQGRLAPVRFVYLLGIFSSLMVVSQALGPPIGAYVLGAFGERAMFAVAALPAIAGLALTFGLRPLERPTRPTGLRLFSVWRPHFPEPILAVFVSGTMSGFTLAYLAAALEARTVPIASFFIASTMSLFASRFFALRYIEDIDRRILVASGLGLMGLGFVAVALAHAAWSPVIAGGMLYGTGYSLVYPLLSAWMSEGIEPSQRAGPQALLNTAFNLGLFATPYPETIFILQFGYEATLILLACCGFATALFLIRRSRHLRVNAV
ncbi:MAG: MFS transporter [Beijerinckiaceae bacterium]